MTTNTVNRIIWEWGMRCFGHKHMLDRRVRALRLVEEAIELCQAVDIPREKVYRVASMVYDRPHDDAFQELGGVMLTSIVMARCLGSTPEVIIEEEILRCLGKRPEEFTKHDEEKMEKLNAAEQV